MDVARSVIRHPRSSVARAALAALLFTTAAAAAAPPTLSVTAHATRSKTSGLGPIPVYETHWWVDVRAQPGDAPLTRLEYQARFGDTAGVRPFGSSWEVADTNGSSLSGRVTVTCAAPADYDRPLRVQLRVRDAAGAESDWAEVEFSRRADVEIAPPPAAASGQVLTEARTGLRYERLGTVEVDATDAMTVGEVKAALQRRAREQGGDAALGFRLAGNTTEQVTFAADVVRHADVTPTMAAATPTQSDRILGEINVPASRR